MLVGSSHGPEPYDWSRRPPSRPKAAYSEIGDKARHKVIFDFVFEAQHPGVSPSPKADTGSRHRYLSRRANCCDRLHARLLQIMGASTAPTSVALSAGGGAVHSINKRHCRFRNLRQRTSLFVPPDQDIAARPVSPSALTTHQRGRPGRSTAPAATGTRPVLCVYWIGYLSRGGLTRASLKGRG